MNGLFSELQKIAEDAAATSPEAAAKIVGVPAAELAYALGTAKMMEGKSGLRRAAELAARIGGLGGAALGVAQGRPGLAAGAHGLVFLPSAIEKIEGSVRGYRGLEGSGLTPSQKAEVRRRLIARGVGKILPMAAWTASSGLRAAKTSNDPIGSLMGPITTLSMYPVARMGLAGPDVDEAKAEQLAARMGVEAPLHRGRSFSMYVAPGSRVPLLFGLQHRLQSGSKSEARKLRERGGVIVPVHRKRA